MCHNDGVACVLGKGVNEESIESGAVKCEGKKDHMEVYT